MKRIVILFVALISLTFISCDKENLGVEDYSVVTEADTWGSRWGESTTTGLGQPIIKQGESLVSRPGDGTSCNHHWMQRCTDECRPKECTCVGVDHTLGDLDFDPERCEIHSQGH